MAPNHKLPKKMLLKCLALLFITSVPFITCDQWDELLNEVDTSKWLDPNGMGVDLTIKETSTEEKVLQEEPVNEIHTKEDSAKTTTQMPNDAPIIDRPKNDQPAPSRIEDTFYFRHVYRVLKSFELEEASELDPRSRYNFIIDVEISASEIGTLNNFLRLKKSKISSEHAGMLHDVDQILGNIFSDVQRVDEASKPRFKDKIFQFFSLHNLSGDNIFWAILTGSALCLVYLMRMGAPVGRWVVVLLVISFLWHWGHLYKKELTKQQMVFMKSKDIPPACRTDDSFFGRISRMFSSNTDRKCAEYYETVFIDPVWRVSPSQAIAEMVTQFVIHPLGPLGVGLGKFFSSLMSELSWLTATPVLFFIFAMTAFMILMLFGYQIRIPYLMASIEPGVKQHQSREVFELERKIEELQQRIERYTAITTTATCPPASQRPPVESSVEPSTSETSLETCNEAAGTTRPALAPVNEIVEANPEVSAVHVLSSKLDRLQDSVSRLTSKVLVERESNHETKANLPNLNSSTLSQDDSDFNDLPSEDFQWIESGTSCEAEITSRPGTGELTKPE